MVSDVFPLLDQVSGIVTIARLDATPRDALGRMVEIIRSAGGRVFGIVATGAKGGTLRGYQYGYGYEAEVPIVSDSLRTPGSADPPSAPPPVDNGGDVRKERPPSPAGPPPNGGRRSLRDRISGQR